MGHGPVGSCGSILPGTVHSLWSVSFPSQSSHWTALCSNILMGFIPMEVLLGFEHGFDYKQWLSQALLKKAQILSHVLVYLCLLWEAQYSIVWWPRRGPGVWMPLRYDSDPRNRGLFGPYWLVLCHLERDSREDVLIQTSSWSKLLSVEGRWVIGGIPWRGLWDPNFFLSLSLSFLDTRYILLYLYSCYHWCIVSLQAQNTRLSNHEPK